ncbi:PhnD/SsuA/transferrin family substrate-binding protein [Sulfuritortus calidifontis]|uniref:substrate-binding domain-containing protein n=1 Tax=Sulfuritortus calidifontis TaxID=1914471 RepID=UPI001E2AA1F5|nr:PhnD/SsuA/transferrin family substrate-binding protein [Sulfuritortus calidifontis]
MLLAALLALPVWAARPLELGLTPAFLHDQHFLLQEWKAYLEKKLHRQVNFVLRDSYRETMDLIEQDRLDFAWVCDYPYVMLQSRVRLLATPLYQKRPYYRSYLIVPARDRYTSGIAQLKGQVFAYADPYSNTGYLAPRYEIKRLGENPDGFFRKTFFTWSHRKAIEAVALGLAQGAAVDSYIWDSLARVEPELTSRTRIVQRSEEFGFPPFVANRKVNEADLLALRQVLTGMTQDPEGRALLAKLNLDGFIESRPELYATVAEMFRLVDGAHR